MNRLRPDKHHISSLCNAWLPVCSVPHRRYHPGMQGTAAPTVTPSQVLDGLRAAYAYCRAIEVLRGGLERTEKQALEWCVHADGEFAAVWDESTKAQRAEASDLLAEIAAYVEPAGRRRRRPARSAIIDRTPKPPQHAPEREMPFFVPKAEISRARQLLARWVTLLGRPPGPLLLAENRKRPKRYENGHF